MSRRQIIKTVKASKSIYLILFETVGSLISAKTGYRWAFKCGEIGAGKQFPGVPPTSCFTCFAANSSHEVSISASLL